MSLVTNGKTASSVELPKASVATTQQKVLAEVEKMRVRDYILKNSGYLLVDRNAIVCDSNPENIEIRFCSRGRIHTSDKVHCGYGLVSKTLNELRDEAVKSVKSTPPSQQEIFETKKRIITRERALEKAGYSDLPDLEFRVDESRKICLTRIENGERKRYYNAATSVAGVEPKSIHDIYLETMEEVNAEMAKTTTDDEKSK